ncbi:MAG: hypothetical protein JRJ62_01540 [Deltaproteobacteria bacterium]|nr:hypothetical protein [Deltaproteobacteria bacterium]
MVSNLSETGSSVLVGINHEFAQGYVSDTGSGNLKAGFPVHAIAAAGSTWDGECDAFDPGDAPSTENMIAYGFNGVAMERPFQDIDDAFATGKSFTIVTKGDVWVPVPSNNDVIAGRLVYPVTNGFSRAPDTGFAYGERRAVGTALMTATGSSWARIRLWGAEG